jgi:uncharacterized membrane-anchored protein YjiN (DUF445 family)
MSFRRKHHKVRNELPDELIEAVNKRLIEGDTYREVAEWINQKGYEISKSAVGRYGKDFLSRLERLKVVKEQAKTIVEEGADRPATELYEATSQLATQLIMETLVKVDKDELESADVVKLLNVIPKLETSATKREKIKLSYNQGVDAAAERIKEELKAELGKDGELIEKITTLVNEIKDEVKS